MFIPKVIFVLGSSKAGKNQLLEVTFVNKTVKFALILCFICVVYIAVGICTFLLKPCQVFFHTPLSLQMYMCFNTIHCHFQLFGDHNVLSLFGKLKLDLAHIYPLQQCYTMLFFPVCSRGLCLNFLSPTKRFLWRSLNSWWEFLVLCLNMLSMFNSHRLSCEHKTEPRNCGCAV